jgi:hypothetical protein
VLAAVLFLEDEEADLLALGRDREVGRCATPPTGLGRSLGEAERGGVALFLGGGDECLDEA